MTGAAKRPKKTSLFCFTVFVPPDLVHTHYDAHESHEVSSLGYLKRLSIQMDVMVPVGAWDWVEGKMNVS